MVFLFINHKTEIVLQILITYVAWTSASMPILENPSEIHHLNNGVIRYNVKPPIPRNYYKRSPTNGNRAPMAFHNDVMLPPQMHQFQPHHNNAPPNVYTMDPVLGAPNPLRDTHHELKHDVSALKDHLLMLADAQRSLLDHLKIPQKSSSPNTAPTSRAPYNEHQSSSPPQQQQYHIEHNNNVEQSRPNNYQIQQNQPYNNNNNENKMNNGNQEPAAVAPPPYYPPPPFFPPPLPLPQLPPMPMPMPVPALPDLPYGNENYQQQQEKPSSYATNYNQNDNNYQPHHGHNRPHHQHYGHNHHHHKYHHSNGTGSHKGRLERLINRRKRIRNRKLSQLNNTFQNGLNKVFGVTPAQTQAVADKSATETLEIIKDGVSNALWTALIVAGVKLTPLLFMGLKMLFRSFLPMAGLAAFTSGATTIPTATTTTTSGISTNTHLDLITDYDDDLDDYDYDHDDNKYHHGKYHTGYGNGGYNNYGGGEHKRGRRGRPSGGPVTTNSDKNHIDDDIDKAAASLDDLDDDFDEEDQLDDDYDDNLNDHDGRKEKDEYQHHDKKHTKKHYHHHSTGGGHQKTY